MKIKNIKNQLDAKLFGASMAVSTALLPLTSYATGMSGYSLGGDAGTGIVNGFGKMMAKLGTYGGALYAIGAIFALILSVRNEDTEGRNKAILNLLAAVALFSTGAIINLFLGTSF